MRIGIDARTILNPEKGEAAGIGHYTYQLIRHLLIIDKENDYFLFFDKRVQQKRLRKFEQKNVRFRFFPFISYKRFLPSAYRNFLITAFISRENLDIFHSPIPSLPRGYKAPTVITVHDLTIYKFPELYTEKELIFLKSDISAAVRSAEGIIAVSQSTKKDLNEIFGISAEKIKVIYHGIDARFFRKCASEEIKKVKKRYGIKKEYLLFLGTLEPRKNILRIVEAYERFRDRLVHLPQLKPEDQIKENLKGYSVDYQLVLAGQPGSHFEEIKKRIDESKYKDDIILPGYIDADDLDQLFEGAKLFIFPTLYEGFGIPVIEAMANGVPVITSNISSLPEIAQGRAILVNPFNVAEISQAIFDLLTNKQLYNEISQKGREKAMEFDWEKTAKETLNFYKEIAKLTNM